MISISNNLGMFFGLFIMFCLIFVMLRFWIFENWILPVIAKKVLIQMRNKNYKNVYTLEQQKEDECLAEELGVLYDIHRCCKSRKFWFYEIRANYIKDNISIRSPMYQLYITDILGESENAKKTVGDAIEETIKESTQERYDEW